MIPPKPSQVNNQTKCHTHDTAKTVTGSLLLKEIDIRVHKFNHLITVNINTTCKLANYCKN